MVSRWRKNVWKWGMDWPGVTLAAQVLEPFAEDELPNFLSNFTWTVAGRRYAQGLALANVEFPPLWVWTFDITDSPPHFPYGIAVEPDVPE